jgi:hypothetical protein
VITSFSIPNLLSGPRHPCDLPSRLNEVPNCAALEPVIGQHRMGRNYLAHHAGDAANERMSRFPARRRRQPDHSSRLIGAKRQRRGDVVTHAPAQCNDVSRRQLSRSDETRHGPESNSKLRVTAATAAARSEGRAS